jgi:hypothetical protein
MPMHQSIPLSTRKKKPLTISSKRAYDFAHGLVEHGGSMKPAMQHAGLTYAEAHKLMSRKPFREYVNELAGRAICRVEAQLLKQALKGNVPAIKLFLERFGNFAERISHEVSGGVVVGACAIEREDFEKALALGAQLCAFRSEKLAKALPCEVREVPAGADDCPPQGGTP